MKITEEKLRIIVSVIELNDKNALEQIQAILENKSSLPLTDSEKENLKRTLKNLEEGRKSTYGGLYPDYL